MDSSSSGSGGTGSLLGLTGFARHRAFLRANARSYALGVKAGAISQRRFLGSGIGTSTRMPTNQATADSFRVADNPLGTTMSHPRVSVIRQLKRLHPTSDRRVTLWTNPLEHPPWVPTARWIQSAEFGVRRCASRRIRPTSLNVHRSDVPVHIDINVNRVAARTPCLQAPTLELPVIMRGNIVRLASRSPDSPCPIVLDLLPVELRNRKLNVVKAHSGRTRVSSDQLLASRGLE